MGTYKQEVNYVVCIACNADATVWAYTETGPGITGLRKARRMADKYVAANRVVKIIVKP